jgi:hypothetical protein
MNDQTIQTSIESLCKEWQALKTALYDCDDIRADTFQEVFRNTDQCLRHCVTAHAVGKEYIPLIADVYGFVDAPAGDDDVQTQAAKILAERMLYQYVINTNVDVQNASCVTIYLLKSKRQLTLDFSNVNVALSLLMEALR